MRIFVTGGCGYKGSVLIPKLLDLGFEVTNYDSQWFGNYLKPHHNLKSIKGDLRNFADISLKGYEVVVHLANVANDPAVELNPTMSWEVNVLATHQLVEKAFKDKVKQFIFASSGSVYGIKDEEKVTEDLPLLPISTYNKTKMIAERVLMSYKSQIKIHCIRPATVCGLSPRMRLDVAVNLLTFQALSKNKITVFGGQQIRPNIHIDDICDTYIHFINKTNLESGFYNAGFENVSILDIAKLIKSKINCELEIKFSNDPRSYRQDSTKLINTGFKPKKNISYAIEEIISSYRNGELKDYDHCHTVKWMKLQNIQ